MAFNVTSEVNDGIAKVALAGELDASVAGEFRDVIESVAAEQPKRVVLLLDGLTFMASAGLRVLIFAKQKLGSMVDLYVVGAQGNVLETMTMTGFHHSVILLDSYDASEIENV